MSTTTTTQAQNPFRSGSKLHKIFYLLADEKRHSLEALTDAGFFPGASRMGGTFYRRRTSSAIRSVRATMEKKGLGTVSCGTLSGSYKLILY